jgi:hypothetical protein
MASVATPSTILNEEPVQKWFIQARAVDNVFCKRLRFMILRRHSGTELSGDAVEAIVGVLKTFLSLIFSWLMWHRIWQQTFGMVSEAIQNPCPTLADWLQAEAGEPMRVDVVDPIDNRPVPADPTLVDQEQMVVDVDNSPASMCLSGIGEDESLGDASEHSVTSAPTPMNRVEKTSRKRKHSEVYVLIPVLLDVVRTFSELTSSCSNSPSVRSG